MLRDNREVIVVEDDPDVLHVAAKKLAKAGYKPIRATDGTDAIRRMIEHPDCRRMVTDYLMPGLGGDPWIRFLERFCGDWTVIVVSTEDIDSGGFVTVPKPVDYRNLVQIFERRKIATEA